MTKQFSPVERPSHGKRHSIKKSVAIFHSMQIKSDFVSGGVQKVVIKMVKGFHNAGWRSFLVQDKDNAALVAQASDLCLEEVSVNIEPPTLNNDFGGLKSFTLIKKCVLIINSCWKGRRARIVTDAVILNDVTSLFYNLIFDAKVEYLFLHSERFFYSKIARIAITIWPKKRVVVLAPTTDIYYNAQELFKFNEIILCNTPVFETTPSVTESRISSKFSNADRLRVCFIGRISPIKNLDQAIWFLFFLSARIPLIFDVYGAPRDLQQNKHLNDLKKLASELTELSQNIQINFRGTTGVPASTFEEYDFSILFSAGEAVPLAALESISAGTPLLAWDARGVNEVAINGRTAIIVASDLNQVEREITSIEKSVKTFEFDYEFGAKLLKKFSIQSFVDDLEFDLSRRLGITSC